MNILKVKCLLCGKEVDSTKESIEKHLKENHFIGYQEYYEIIKSWLIDNEYLCWRCGNPKNPLCSRLNTYYLPCSQCLTTKRSDIIEFSEKILNDIKDYQKKIMKDKFYQLFLSSPWIIKESLSHEFNETKLVLENICKRDQIKIGKNDAIIVKNIVGSTKEISSRNIDNLNIELSNCLSLKKSITGFEIFLGRDLYSIELPESCEYDIKHHSRYSILNLNSKRSTKKLKMSSGDCIKFYPSKYSNYRSLLRLKNSKGEIVDPDELSNSEYLYLKMAILRNGTIMKRLFEIYNEFCKYVEILRDSVFLLNTIWLGKNRNNIIYLSWKPELIESPVQINISIL